ncbi:MAG: HAMP domain-containing sensor histidine kinase [Eubacteriales bacterium]|nr:HAMP domain-containing sensor histidine kinase [Eubacteriales bacterium]
MDRTSHTKLRHVLLISLAFLVCCGLILYARVQAQFAREEAVILSLSNHVPETTGELLAVLQGENHEGKSSGREETNEDQAVTLRKKYQYGPMDFKSCRNLTAAGVSMMAAGVLGILGLYILLESKKKAREKDDQRQITRIEDQLKEMARGRYDDSTEEECLPEYVQIEQFIREAQLRFTQLTESAQLEEQETKELITNISHQLKTPLASIKLSFEMMEYDKLTEEERESFFLKGKAEVEKLDGLFQILLNLSRLEKGIIEVKPCCGDIKDCILSAVDSVYMKARRKGIELSLDADEKILCCYDRKWTAEAFVNLLDNAVKYSNADTKIRIRISSLPHYCLVEIEDEGIGIKREEYHKVFQRFYRGARASEMEDEGAGVGLYLARMVIEQQKGLIKIKSKAGTGTIVQVMVPREV